MHPVVVFFWVLFLFCLVFRIHSRFSRLSSIALAMTPPARRASVAIPATTRSSVREKLIGYFCAVCSGVANGFSMIPMKYAPAQAKFIIYVLSFSIGVAILTPPLVIVTYLVKRRFPLWKAKATMPFAILGGTLWSIGYFCATYAALLLGISVGVPLTQTALLVAAFWGIVVFKEIRGWLEIGVFCLGAAVIVCGAFLLGSFG